MTQLCCFDMSYLKGIHALLLHEQKLVKTHEELFTLVQEKVPSLNKANNRAIVTDGERPIIKAIKKNTNFKFGAILESHFS